MKIILKLMFVGLLGSVFVPNRAEAQNGPEDLNLKLKLLLPKTAFVFRGTVHEITKTNIKFCQVDILKNNTQKNIETNKNCLLFPLEQEQYPSVDTPVFMKEREYILFVSYSRDPYVFTAMTTYGLYRIINGLVYDYFGDVVLNSQHEQVDVNYFIEKTRQK